MTDCAPGHHPTVLAPPRPPHPPHAPSQEFHALLQSFGRNETLESVSAHVLALTLSDHVSAEAVPFPLKDGEVRCARCSWRQSGAGCMAALPLHTPILCRRPAPARRPLCLQVIKTLRHKDLTGELAPGGGAALLASPCVQAPACGARLNPLAPLPVLLPVAVSIDEGIPVLVGKGVAAGVSGAPIETESGATILPIDAVLQYVNAPTGPTEAPTSRRRLLSCSCSGLAGCACARRGWGGRAGRGGDTAADSSATPTATTLYS